MANETILTTNPVIEKAIFQEKKFVSDSIFIELPTDASNDDFINAAKALKTGGILHTKNLEFLKLAVSNNLSCRDYDKHTKVYSFFKH